MFWTRDTVHMYYIPDSLEGLPDYKRQAYTIAASGITHWLLIYLGDGNDYHSA